MSLLNQICNIVVIGPRQSGKTMLMKRCMFQGYTDTYISTMIVEPIEIRYKQCSYLWWDTASYPSVCHHNKYPLRRANKIVVCYDGRSEESYDEACTMVDALDADDIKVLMVATYADDGGVRKNPDDFLVSSKTGSGILEIIGILYDGSGVIHTPRLTSACW